MKNIMGQIRCVGIACLVLLHAHAFICKYKRPATLRNTAKLRSRFMIFEARTQAHKVLIRNEARKQHKTSDNQSGFRNLPNHSAREILPVSEIRLRRTDTTLDLSQKAEKV